MLLAIPSFSQSANLNRLLVQFHSLRFAVLLVLILVPASVRAGGPKYVAGTSFFNPAVAGRPLHWANGQLNYYVDQGPLSSSVTNQQATVMVDAAAALWSAVPTAAVTLTDSGFLNEDVSDANILAVNGQITQPPDITSAATSYPVGVIYDSDGSVTDAVFGTGASQPTSCQRDGVRVWMDNFNPDATIAHAVILLNGLCAANAAQLQMMSFELERAFGRILNLDYAQVNPTALADNVPSELLGWPIMQPISGLCGTDGGACVPNPSVLRYDDMAALNRIYPVTAENLAQFSGKHITASNTVSLQGTITFRTGAGMQGVNVVARPLDANGKPLYQYTVTAVSGVLFNGNHGNPITGFVAADGTPFTEWGSNDPALQGHFDLSGIPLPPGATSSGYEITFEAINPVYILNNSVGAYIDGQPAPSGTLATITLPALSVGSSQTLSIPAADSAAGGYQDAISIPASPRMLPPSGFWCGRISQIGQSDWFTFPARANRTFTVVTQALDETGAPTENKAMPAIGVWDAFDPVGSAPIGAGPGMNGIATGESWLRVSSIADDIVRIGIADQRGDGRPDYAYDGWVLYADTVQPQRLPSSGGPIVIHGTGFRLADTVLVGGQPAPVTSISPDEITAIAPPAASGVTGSIDVEVDDLPSFYAAAIISGGVSYNATSGDALTLNNAPMNTVPSDVPISFSVTALAPDLTPAGGVSVLYSVTSGTATLACGLQVCAVAATGDGRATMNVTAHDGTWSIVTASLTNGSSVQAQFAGGTPPILASATPQLSLSAGVTIAWTVLSLVLNDGVPSGGQTVTFQSANQAIAVLGPAAAVTDPTGLATKSLSVGPLAEGQKASATACLNGTSQCVSFTALGARAEYASIQAVSGTTQNLSLQFTPSQITLRLLDMNGNPMAGGSVTLYQALYAWTPPCPAHGPCDPAPLLSTQIVTATSAIDGSVNFAPASLPGVATNLYGLAASGNTAAINIFVEQHP